MYMAVLKRQSIKSANSRGGYIISFVKGVGWSSLTRRGFTATFALILLSVILVKEG